jgi:hypothetical protein
MMRSRVVRDNRPELAERIRLTLVAQAVAAFEDAGMQGLCCEGAWEAAIAAMRRADLTRVLEHLPSPRQV